MKNSENFPIMKNKLIKFILFLVGNISMILNSEIIDNKYIYNDHNDKYNEFKDEISLLEKEQIKILSSKSASSSKQIKQLSKGISSLNIVPGDEIGMIYLRLQENRVTYSFGLDNKKFSIKQNDDNKLVMTKDNIILNSKNMILNAISVLNSVNFNYKYNVIKETIDSKFPDKKKLEMFEENKIQSQWRMIISDNFVANKTSLGWNYLFTTVCGEYNILGGAYQISRGKLEKIITTFPRHEYVNIEMNVHFFGNWNGETLYIQIDSEGKSELKYYWTKRCITPKIKPMISMCENIDYCRIGEKVSFSLKHYSNYFKIVVGSTLDAAPDIKSFGISDFRLYVK